MTSREAFEALAFRALTPDEFAKLIRDSMDNDNTEAGHMVLDNILCRQLENLGFGAGTKEYYQQKKRYA